MKKILIIAVILLYSCTMAAGPLTVTISPEQVYELYKKVSSRNLSKAAEITTTEGYIIRVK